MIEIDPGLRMTRNSSGRVRLDLQMGTGHPARARLLAGALTWALALIAPGALAQAAAPVAWTAASPGPTATGPLAMSCPSEALCLAVDHAGHALRSTDPTAASPEWSTGATPIDPGHPLTGVSCPNEGLCVAIDEAGQALVSTDPTDSSPAWSATTIDGHALTGLSCPSSTLCVAVDDAGDALVSTQPAAGTWQAPTGIDAGHALSGVSCASAALCVAADEDGKLLSTTEPSNPAHPWSAYPTSAAFGGITCEPSGVCVAYAQDFAYASADPGAPQASLSALGPTWSGTLIDGSGRPLVAASCAASGLCVALDQAGGALAADDPTSATPHWEAGTLPSGGSASPPASAVSCLPGGVCVAVGAPSGGGPLSSYRGIVPAPEASTTAGQALSATKIKVSGAVNPKDAVLRSCAFQYGASASYGRSVPCEAIPASANTPQGVGATIEGLSPGTVYHFRLVVEDAAGQGVGGDQTVKTLPPPSLVYPKPTISGKAVAGQPLTCKAHLPAGAKATLGYLWLRGLSPIEGQVSRQYQPTAADIGHHLQCQVTATNEAGSVTRTSPFVSVPLEGVLALGETDVVKADFAHTRVEIAASCSKLATQGCTIEATLAVIETLRGRKLIAVASHAPRHRARARVHASRHRAHARASRHRARKRRPPRLRRLTVVIGSANVSIEANHDRVVKVLLNAQGRKLLHERSNGVQAQLTVVGTVVGVQKTRLRQEVVTIAPRRRLRAPSSRA